MEVAKLLILVKTGLTEKRYLEEAILPISLWLDTWDEDTRPLCPECGTQMDNLWSQQVVATQYIKNNQEVEMGESQPFDGNEDEDYYGTLECPSCNHIIHPGDEPEYLEWICECSEGLIECEKCRSCKECCECKADTELGEEDTESW
jgi:hypothetical protein